MEKVSKTVLNKVISDWQEQFTGLERLKSGQKILKRVSFVALGIELEKYLSDAYRPRFVLYNLLDSSNSKLITSIDQTLKNKKGLEVSIKYSQHEAVYLEACKLMKKQARVDILNTPNLEGIIDGILTFVDKDIMGNPFYSCLAVMQLSRMLDKEKSRDKYFEKALKELNKIPKQLLEMQTKGFDVWVDKIRNLKPEELKEAEKESLRKHKLEEIPLSGLSL